MTADQEPTPVVLKDKTTIATTIGAASAVVLALVVSTAWVVNWASQLSVQIAGNSRAVSQLQTTITELQESISRGYVSRRDLDVWIELMKATNSENVRWIPLPR